MVEDDASDSDDDDRFAVGVVTLDSTLPDDCNVSCEKEIDVEGVSDVIESVVFLRVCAPDGHYLIEEVESRRRARARIPDRVAKFKDNLALAKTELNEAKKLVEADKIAIDLDLKRKNAERQRLASYSRKRKLKAVGRGMEQVVQRKVKKVKLDGLLTKITPIERSGYDEADVIAALEAVEKKANASLASAARQQRAHDLTTLELKISKLLDEGPGLFAKQARLENTREKDLSHTRMCRSLCRLLKAGSLDAVTEATVTKLLDGYVRRYVRRYVESDGKKDDDEGGDDGDEEDEEDEEE